MKTKLQTIKGELNYDPDTGIFTWIKAKQGRPLGKRAGAQFKNGYRIIMINNEKVYEHRLAAIWMRGELDDKLDVHHIDGNPSNNKWDNLEVSTRSQNIRSQKPHKNKLIKYKGVSYDKVRGLFTAQIKPSKEESVKYLGAFKNPEDAAKTYDQAAELFFGMFALTNKQLGLL